MTASDVPDGLLHLLWYVLFDVLITNENEYASDRRSLLDCGYTLGPRIRVGVFSSASFSKPVPSSVGGTVSVRWGEKK